MDHLEVQLKTLTPLWTGGVDGTMDRIHETGIIGSLRWWYEAIVRGLGGSACDPSKGECSFDAEKYRKSKAADERRRLRDAGLCDVCQVFGATGWKRRFRLSIQDANLSEAEIQHTIKANRTYIDSKGKHRTPTWYFRDPTQSRPAPNTPKIGHFIIQIKSLARDFPSEIIAGLIQFVANWTALGARTQMGFGVVDLVDGRVDTRPFFEWLKPVAGNNTYPHLPSLQNIFLARISPKDGGQFNEQDTFNLKYDLRHLFAKNSQIRHFVMGKVYMSGPRKGKRIAAKVKMSRPYNDGQEIRVWGWIPEQTDEYPENWNRERVVSAIYDHLSKNYTLQVWREMNSSRDTVLQNKSNAQVFLRSLLESKEKDNAA